MKKDNWPELLVEFIELRRNKPFCWGGNDCCSFASDWVYECSGIDVFAKFRGRYKTAIGAVRLFKAEGGLFLATKKVMEEHGFTEIPPAFIQRGDIAFVEDGAQKFNGVSDGSGIIGPAKDGICKIKLKNVKAAWRLK